MNDELLKNELLMSIGAIHFHMDELTDVFGEGQVPPPHEILKVFEDIRRELRYMRERIEGEE